jgi:hypothetical protein
MAALGLKWFDLDNRCDLDLEQVGGQTTDVGDNPVRMLDEAPGNAFEGLSDRGFFTGPPGYEHLLDRTSRLRVHRLDELPSTEVLVAFEYFAHVPRQELHMVIDEPPQIGLYSAQECNGFTSEQIFGVALLLEDG